jgi:hypothetical protein
MIQESTRVKVERTEAPPRRSSLSHALSGIRHLHLATRELGQTRTGISHTIGSEMSRLTTKVVTELAEGLEPQDVIELIHHAARIKM